MEIIRRNDYKAVVIAVGISKANAQYRVIEEFIDSVLIIGESSAVVESGVDNLFKRRVDRILKKDTGKHGDNG